ERCHLPARAGGRGVLHRPRSEIDRGRAAVEELDEVVRVRCAAVATTSVHLTVNHVGGSAPRDGHYQQCDGEEEGTEQSNSMHGQLRSERDVSSSLVAAAARDRNGPFAN